MGWVGPTRWKRGWEREVVIEIERDNEREGGVHLLARAHPKGRHGLGPVSLEQHEKCENEVRR